MSKVLVDRQVLLFLNGETELEGLGFGERQEGKPFWWRKYLREALAQPAEAEGVDEFNPRCLDKWLRQYCHNDGSPGFVFGYEAKGTEQLVDRLRAALSAVTAERDRLRKDRDDCLEARQYYADKYGEVIAERERLCAEIERLLGAMRQIRYARNNGPVSENNARCIRRIEQIADAAMAAKEA